MGASGDFSGERGRRGRVLIVDDDPAVAKTLGRVLGLDHDTAVVVVGRDAVERIRGGERYDAILCDLNLPDVDGPALHAEVTALAPEQAARIIFVSGGAFTPSSRAFLERVPNPRVDKPFDAQVLRDIVRRVVDGPE